MAWNVASTAKIVFFFRDDDEAVSRHTIHVPISTLDNAVEVAKQYAALVKAVSDCALWKIHINFGAWSDGPQRGTPGSSILVQSVLVFGSGTSSRYVFSVPGLITSKLLQAPNPYAGVQLDSSDTDIVALAAAMISGINGTYPVAPWNPGWVDVSGGGGGWGGGGGGGGFGGGGGGGSWGDGWDEGSGGGGGGGWGIGGPGGEFTWTGEFLMILLVAYRGYVRTRFE
jgi:uncharacterized membrane protein YgcG